MTIAQRLADVKHRISLYEQTYARKAHSIFLLAVSKGQSIDKIKQALAAKQFAFGESYVQEALQKMAVLKDEKQMEWHFIGSIQSNKTKKIAEHFTWVHSIADARTAERLNSHRPIHLPPLQVCIEVNITEERTKSGVAWRDIEKLAAYCKTLPQLTLRGLMTLPLPTPDFTLQRAAFAKLHALFIELNQKKYGLDTLSMGMSDDLEAAIAEGATCVRIGSAIFGPRERDIS